MPETLTDIQATARDYTNNSQLNITTGDGARAANLLYVGMCAPSYRHGFRGVGMVHVGRRWRELLKLDSSVTTTAGTSAYTFPSTLTFHQDEFKVFYVDASASSEEVPIKRVTDIEEWAEEKATSNQFPSVYMLYNDGTNDVIEFRPTPDTTGDTINIWGYTQPTSLTASATTVFAAHNIDKAFALLVAADWLAKRSKTQRASELLDQAMGLLPLGDRGTMMYRPRLRATQF